MSKISDKLNIIDNAKNDIKTAIENKGINVGDVGLQEYAGKIGEIKASVPVTKGIVINAYDSNGYPTDASIVGITEIPPYYLYNSTGSYTNSYTGKIVNINIPDNVTKIGRYAFTNCRNLVLTKLPSALKSTGDYVFQNCANIAITELPVGLTRIEPNAFDSCSTIDSIKALGNIVFIGGYAFYYCKNLTKIILLNITSVPTLGSYAFNNTPIADGTGYIYVPDSLVDSFKTATNWSTYASQIKGLSELEG